MKPKIPNQKKLYAELKKRLDAYTLLIDGVYNSLNDDAARLALSTGYSGGVPFRWKDYPKTEELLLDLRTRFVKEMRAVVHASTSKEWEKSNEAQDAIANGALKCYKMKQGDKQRKYYRNNSAALEAFQKRRTAGLNLSQRLWNQSADYQSGLEAAISVGIEKGMSAVTLSKRLSQYLNDYPKLRKDYKELYGTATDIRDCEYNSARLARTEINMAYRSAEQERWKQFDFVVGKRIKTSSVHPDRMPHGDICDTLAGDYPKDFEWSGWHPQCYPSDTYILTRNGWKLFKDVSLLDDILSLIPDTRSIEYVRIKEKQAYHYKGVLEHFYNRNLDCAVTPDHRMVYLNKTNGGISFCKASEYSKGKGAFYRSCLYDAPDIESINIGGIDYPFDVFCEFMGYYLSDGSLQHDYMIIIAQKDGEKNKSRIIEGVSKLGYKVTSKRDFIELSCKSLNAYLRQFGKCYYKFIPREIMSASKRQIEIFLDAFARCDGSVRKSHSFVGNRGTVFVAKSSERIFFTTSDKMASQIMELLLKIGKRPSHALSKIGTTHKKDGSAIISRKPCHNIRECNSETATVFYKEQIPYDGMVYDLTLERNHIMYIMRNGKCFWGSNCMCFEVPVMKTDDEFWNEDEDFKSENEVEDVPDNFKEWVKDNQDRIEAAEKRGTQPYFIRDNKETVNDILGTNDKPTPQEIAEKRHAARTESDVEDIQSRWNKHRIINLHDQISDLGLQADSRLNELMSLLSDDNSLSEFDYFKQHYNEALDIVSKVRYQQIGKTEELMKTALFAANNKELEAALGVKRGEAMSFNSANELRGNPNYLADRTYRINCQTTVFANEMRRRGFPVEALPNLKGSKLEELSRNTALAWLDEDGKTPTRKLIGTKRVLRTNAYSHRQYYAYEKTCANRKQLINELESQLTEDGRYHISWAWKTGNSGHIITVEKIGDEIKYYDPQNGLVISDFYNYISDIDLKFGIKMLRVDNLRANPEMFKHVLTKSGTKPIFNKK